MSTSESLQELVEPVISLARSAGDGILTVYNTDFSVNYKEDDSPLTLADRIAHDVIIRGLRELGPGYPVLSEEGVDIPYPERASWGKYWLVDPLDGTREFIKKNGEFTVNIALMEDCQPVLGVIQVPVTGKVYCAWRGGGAYVRGDDAGSTRLRVAPPAGELRVVCSRSHPSPDLKKFLEYLNGYSTLSVGSSLKICLIAEGKADLYPRFGPTSEWDIAAADCILRESGGTVTQLDFTPMQYNKPSLLNPSFIAAGPVAGDWRKALGRMAD